MVFSRAFYADPDITSATVKRESYTITAERGLYSPHIMSDHTR